MNKSNFNSCHNLCVIDQQSYIISTIAYTHLHIMVTFLGGNDFRPFFGVFVLLCTAFLTDLTPVVEEPNVEFEDLFLIDADPCSVNVRFDTLIPSVGDVMGVEEAKAFGNSELLPS